MELSKYLTKLDEIYIPYVAEKFDLTIKEVCDQIIKQWHFFENPHMVDDMLHTQESEKRWFYEVCDTKYKRGSIMPHDKLQQYWLDNQKYDQHISVFAHDSEWLKNVRETGSVSCTQTTVKSELFWIELDRKNYNKEANFHQAVKDAQRLRNRILTYDPRAQVWVFTSGNNSTHIAINSNLFGSPVVSQRNTGVFREFAEILTEGLRFGINKPVRKMDEKELKEHFQQVYPEAEFEWDAQIAEASLEDCDTQIYHTNALIRQPWSWHETGKKRKSLVTLNGEFKYEPHLLDIQRQKPSLLHLYIQAWERLKDSKEKKRKRVACDYSSDYIINTYLKHYPEIAELEPDDDGWVGRFHSIFYEDGNPDVIINTQNGYHYDFGSARYSMSFEDFLIKTKKRYTND